MDMLCHKSFDGVQHENPDGGPFARPYKEHGMYTYISTGFDELHHQTMEALDKYAEYAATDNPLPLPDERIKDPLCQKYLPTFFKTFLSKPMGEFGPFRVSALFSFLFFSLLYQLVMSDLI